MNSFASGFARAAVYSALALSTALGGASALAGAEMAPAVPAQNVQQQRQVIFDYNGPDTAEGLQKEIDRLSNGTPVFVMFHATWCPSCRQLSSEFEQAKTRTPLFYRVLRVPVSVGNDPETSRVPYPNLARKFQISAVPDTTGYLDGQPILKFPDEQRTPSLQDLVQNMTDLHQQLLASMQQQPRAPAPRR